MVTKLIKGMRRTGAPKHIKYSATFLGYNVRSCFVPRQCQGAYGNAFMYCVTERPDDKYECSGTAEITHGWLILRAHYVRKLLGCGDISTHVVSSREKSLLNPSTLSREKNRALHADVRLSVVL